MSAMDEMLKCKTWAVVGATNNRDKFGYKIFKFMKEKGFEVYAVNPGITEVLGDKCFATLKDLPIKPEAVDVVVPSSIGEQVMQDCAALKIKNVWLQPGADTEQVVTIAKNLGLNVIHHACIMAEARKLEKIRV